MRNHIKRNLAIKLCNGVLDQRSKSAILPVMAKMIRKGDLPQKTCITCGRPFTWRKKWEKVWDEVRYCSDKCRSTKSGTK